MRNQSIFILLAAIVSITACDKKPSTIEPDGAKTVETEAPVAGTANDISKAGTQPGAVSGVTTQGAEESLDEKSFKATSVDPKDPSNHDEKLALPHATPAAAH